MYYIYFYMQMSNTFSYVYWLSSVLVESDTFSDLYVWPTWIQKSDAYKHSFFCFADVLEKHTREIMRAKGGPTLRTYLRQPIQKHERVFHGSPR